jgi:hypothetical protein
LIAFEGGVKRLEKPTRGTVFKFRARSGRGVILETLR